MGNHKRDSTTAMSVSEFVGNLGIKSAIRSIRFFTLSEDVESVEISRLDNSDWLIISTSVPILTQLTNKEGTIVYVGVIDPFKIHGVTVFRVFNIPGPYSSMTYDDGGVALNNVSEIKCLNVKDQAFEDEWNSIRAYGGATWSRLAFAADADGMC